jgi:hypothetical protein
VGPVSATVKEAETSKGLPVHANPSRKSKLVNHINKNLGLLGENRFEKGWMKLKDQPGWVRIDLLNILPFYSRIVRIKTNDNCVPIRKGPDKNSKKTGCLRIGQIVKFSGLMTEENWLELGDHRGWVSTAHFDFKGMGTRKTIAGGQRPVESEESLDPVVGADDPAKGAQTDPGFNPPNGIVVVDHPPRAGDNGPLPPGNGRDDEGNGQLPPDNGPDEGHPGNGPAAPEEEGAVIGPGIDPDAEGNGDNGAAEDSAPPSRETRPGVFCRGDDCAKLGSGLPNPRGPVYIVEGEEVGAYQCYESQNCSTALADALIDSINDDPDGTNIGTGVGRYWVTINEDGTIHVEQRYGPDIRITHDCSDGAGGIDAECLAEFLSELALSEDSDMQAQTASTPTSGQTLDQDGDQSPGLGELAPPEDKPDGQEPVVSFPSPGSGDGDRRPDPGSADDFSGGWMEIEPPKSEGPPFRSGGVEDSGGKGGSTGPEDSGKGLPVIGAQPDKGQSDQGPPMYTVGDPIEDSGNGSGSSNRPGSGPGNKDIGFTAPGVSINDSGSPGIKDKVPRGNIGGIETPKFDSFDGAFGPIRSGVSIKDSSRIKGRDGGSEVGSSFVKPDGAQGGASFTKPGGAKSSSGIGKSIPSPSPVGGSLNTNPSVKGNFGGKKLRKIKK